MAITFIAPVSAPDLQMQEGISDQELRRGIELIEGLYAAVF